MARRLYFKRAAFRHLRLQCDYILCDLFAVLNSLSEGEYDEGIAKYFLAAMASMGNFFSIPGQIPAEVF